MVHICVSKRTIIGSDNGLSPERRQANIWTNAAINWNLGNKLQWNSKRNSYIFIHENAFENIVCETAVILSRPQCVNSVYQIVATKMTAGFFFKMSVVICMISPPWNMCSRHCHSLFHCTYIIISFVYPYFHNYILLLQSCHDWPDTSVSSQITRNSSVCWKPCSGWPERNHQSTRWLAVC